jgi:riboflavin kinase/FMN adenylyltransferase
MGSLKTEQTVPTDALTQSSAVALGFFDGVHLGHRAVLQEATACAEKKGLVPCAFTFAADSLPVKQGTKLRYLYQDEQKRQLLQACGIQRVLCPAFSQLCDLDGETFCRQILVEQLHAKDVFCGSDFRFGKKAAWDISDLKAFGEIFGFAVHVVSAVCCEGEKVSSTAIRKALENGCPEQAAKLLGAPYVIYGTVCHGKALGRTHFVPTINLPFGENQLLPRFGVYVSQTETPSGCYDSITNIGVNPTVKEDDCPVAETFLLDFTGDLYTQTCKISLHHFLRPEQRFATTEALYAQIAKDQEACRLWRKGHCTV